jgi:hypothetical protein
LQSKKSKTRDKSDIQFVAVVAALIEPVSATKFPAITGIAGNFFNLQGI